VRIPALVCAAVILASAVLVADDHTVIFDEDVDFSTLRTFDVRDARMSSERPELTFPAVMKAIDESVRGALVARGLKLMTDHPDLVAEYRVAGVDYSIGPFGRPNVITPGRGGRGRAMSVDFTEATLVIDLSRPDPKVLIWRGVFHDTENDARILAVALPKDAAKLLSEFPPKKK